MPSLFTVESLIAFLLIGLAAGWLARVLLKRQNMGMLACLVVGVIGAILGAVALGFFGIQHQGLIGTFAASLSGAIVLLLVIGWIR